MLLITTSPIYSFKYGKVFGNKSKYDDDNTAWEYFISGVDVEGVALAVIFTIDLEVGEIILITVRDI